MPFKLKISAKQLCSDNLYIHNINVKFFLFALFKGLFGYIYCSFTTNI
jgi:hypothetical protein